MDKPQLTTVAQDYIKVVWGMQEWSAEPVTTKDLSDRLNVGASTVSETVRRLAAQGLLEHKRYGAISLTELGRTHALDMVRRHRLLETYLVSELGYTWDEVHDEAEILEHAVSDLLIDRIDQKLDHPTRDPHGDPIPTKSLAMDRPNATPLAVLQQGDTGIVARFSDEDPAVLRYFADIGFGLDARITITSRNDAVGVMELNWDNGTTAQKNLTLGLVAAHAVWIEKAH